MKNKVKKTLRYMVFLALMLMVCTNAWAVNNEQDYTKSTPKRGWYWYMGDGKKPQAQVAVAPSKSGYTAIQPSSGSDSEPYTAGSTEAIPIYDSEIEAVDYESLGGGIDTTGENTVFAETAVKSTTYDSPFGVFGVFDASGYRDFIKDMIFEGYFDVPEDYYPWAGNHMQNLGAKWSRQNTLLVWEGVQPNPYGEYIWNDADRTINKAYEHGGDDFNLILAISPKRLNPITENRLDWLNEDEPDLKEPFKNFVKAAVERYRNKVKYWQAGPEEFPKTWSNPGLRGTNDGYIRFLEWMNEAVKDVDGDAKIVLAPLIVSYQPDKPLKESLEKIEEIIKGAAAEDLLFDAIDVHYWDFAENYKMPGIEEIRTILDNNGYENVKIFSLEHGTHVNQPIVPDRIVPYQSEKNQSISLIKRYSYNLANGVSLINWNNLVEWKDFSGKDSDGPFDNMGLISDGDGGGEPPTNLGIPRLSYYTYKKMTETLEGSDWDNIETIREGDDDIYIYKFTKKDLPYKQIWVAWDDTPDYTQSGYGEITITGIGHNEVKITEAVADYETGRDVPYFKTWSVITAPSSGDTREVTIELGENPLFIEENYPPRRR